MKYQELKKNLAEDYSSFPIVKVAVVSDWATQFLVVALKAYAYFCSLKLEIYEAPIGSVEEELLDFSSDLYTFNPDFVLFFPSSENVRDRFYGCDENERARFVENEIERQKNIWKKVGKNSNINVLLCNLCMQNDGVFGNYAASYEYSLLHLIRRMNEEILKISENLPNVSIVDIDSLQSIYGRSQSFDARLYYISKSVFALDFLPTVAARILASIQVNRGQLKKCIVTDLDDTLWGGIIGEDGLAKIQVGELGIGKAFSDYQKWLVELSKRGIAVAVCSKNDEELAKRPFVEHPDMVIKLDDIVVFKANWNDKVANIREIKEVLNIGFDSIVFIDDNPFEREMVKSMLPGVTVPDLPKDPVHRLTYLQNLNLFEAIQISNEDKARTEFYKIEAERVSYKEEFTQLDDYLKSLNMVASIKAFDEFSIPRVAQLTQRSNQFNLRTMRCSEDDISKMCNDNKYLTMQVSLKDRFGDYGIVAVVILEKCEKSTLFIHTLLMSCRVLKRGVETLIFNGIFKLAKEIGTDTVIGEYIETEKNGLVKNLLSEYGFTLSNDMKWVQDVDLYQIRETNITEE